jgi:hypothetical protein
MHRELPSEAAKIKIELSEQQGQALRAEPGKTIDVVDPTTGPEATWDVGKEATAVA